MKVLIVNNFLNNTVGGVENYLQALVSYANENQSQISFKWFGVAEQKTKWHQKFYNATTTKAIMSEIDALKPDLIHCFSIGSTVTPHFMVYAKKKNIPIIQSFRDYYYICPKNHMIDLEGKVLEKHDSLLECVLHHYPKKNIFYDSLINFRQHFHSRIIKKNIDYFLTPSENLTQFISSKFKKPGQTLPNPVLISNPFLGEKKADYLLFVGRLAPEKGVLTLIKAFAKVLEKHPNEVLKIVGSGKDEIDLKQFVNQNNIPNVEFLGAKNRIELMELYAAAKFTIVPSEILESYGNVILESFIFQKTVIISDLLGIQKEVLESKSGLVFPFGNVEKLAEATEILLTDHHLRNELEKNALRYVENFSFENHFEQLQNIYKKVLQNNF